MTRRPWTTPRAAGPFALLLLLGATARPVAGQSAVTGQVTEAETGRPLGDARVIVLGANQGATTGESGRFVLRDVRPGVVELQVLRVGYRSVKGRVTVAAGDTATASFQLPAATVQLQEVVTTAIGQQRRVELGNHIATLGDVPRRVEESSTHSVADLLVAKTPGVVVLPSPVVGGAPTIRMRGVSSVTLSNAPIWYVDGVRYLTNTTTSAGTNLATLLNNLSPEEIQDVEIVRGPSAATLYGTDAANGVIVVTTRQGRAGRTRWTFTGERRVVEDRNAYQAQYANWGHAPNAPSRPIRCQLATRGTQPGGPDVGPTACVTDSLTSYDVLSDPERTFIATGRGALYGMSVSGGSEAVRFFSAFELDDEYGPIEMPGWARRRFDSLGVRVTQRMLHPRSQRKLNARTNLSAALGPAFDLAVNAGYGRSSNFIEPDNSAIQSLLYTGQGTFGFKGPGACAIVNNVGCLGKPLVDASGSPLMDFNLFSPGDVMQFVTSNDVHRFTGSGSASWRPIPWLRNDATVGIDLSANDQFHVCRLNECPQQTATARAGNVQDFKQNRRNFSARLASTAAWQARRWASLKTTVGADYTNVSYDDLFAQGRGLAPGASSLFATTTAVAWRATEPTAVKTLGVYAQEQVSLRDRLFVTVAARQDQNSAFGSRSQRVLYPKASLSWTVSEEPFFPRRRPLDAFRVRAAYGASGVQPGATAALQTFQPTTSSIPVKDGTTGVDTPGLTADNPGNANLKPERSAELEAGLDADLLGRRLRLEYTYYDKRTRDALISVPVPPSAGAPVTTLLQNVGATRNWGHEAQAFGVLVARARLVWDVTVSASRNSNAWLGLGVDPLTGEDRVVGAGTQFQQRKGYPLNAQWYRDYTWGDANGDGVIQVGEVAVDTALSSTGYNVPRNLVSVQSALDLFRRRLRVSVLFDHKGGGHALDGTNDFQCSSSPLACRESQDPTAPLAWQARAVAKTYGTRVGGTTYRTARGYYQRNDFWRFREASVAYRLPDRAARWLRGAHGSTVVVAARNLHVWTDWTGVDPEANYGVSGTENQLEFNTSPPPTYLTLRLNVKY